MPKEKLIKKSDLIPDNKNFNKGSQLGQELIKKSISKFGAGRSILIDKNNRIIAGNKTTENFEGEDVLVIETTGEKLIAVKRTDIDLDSPEGREMALADNATAKENIVFDAELIEAEVGEAVCEEWGIKTPVKLEAEEDDFDVPEGGIETDIVLGDLFEIGPHRLLCGDSTDSDSVAKLMNGEKADMVFTDPPYGIGYSSAKFDNVKPQNQGLSTKRNKAEMILGDDKPFDPSFILAICKNIKEIFIWGYQYYPEKLGRGGIIVWNKKTETQADCAHGDFEMCYSKQERNKMFWHTWGGFKNKEKNETRLHTTQKPVALASFFFNEWGKESDLVLDFFLGSGSTMVAAHQLKRKCYGMELDPKYCQVIVDRMIKLDPTLIIKKNGELYAPRNAEA